MEKLQKERFVSLVGKLAYSLLKSWDLGPLLCKYEKSSCKNLVIVVVVEILGG